MESSALSGRATGAGVWEVDVASGGDEAVWNVDGQGRPMKSQATTLLMKLDGRMHG